MPEWLRYMDHTADEGIVVHAGTLPELYARAAWGMFSLIADLSGVRCRETRAVSVEAADREALMVRWLSELNIAHETSGYLFCTFDVTECSETEMQATVGGEKIDRARHVLLAEIKAVTYHMLEVRPCSQGWQASVLFDV